MYYVDSNYVLDIYIHLGVGDVVWYRTGNDRTLHIKYILSWILYHAISLSFLVEICIFPRLCFCNSPYLLFSWLQDCVVCLCSWNPCVLCLGIYLWQIYGGKRKINRGKKTMREQTETLNELFMILSTVATIWTPRVLIMQHIQLWESWATSRDLSCCWLAFLAATTITTTGSSHPHAIDYQIRRPPCIISSS